MNDSTSHSSAIQLQPIQAKRPILYLAPNEMVIEELARQVCVTLGEKYEAYRDPEMVNGLSAFLTVIANLTAKSATNGKADWIQQKHRKK